MFTFSNKAQKEKNIFEDIESHNIANEYSVSKFDLEMVCYELFNGCLGVKIKYLQDLYKAETIKRFMGYYKNILQECVKNPKIRVRDIEIFSEKEIRNQIVIWNETRSLYEKEATIDRLFEGQVEKSPDSVAVVYEDFHLTYGFLNEKSNQLADYLRVECGVKVGDSVALCLERSERMLIGILGILKAGCCYVPLDPQHPKGRMGYILEDLSLKVLLVESLEIKERLKDLTSLRCEVLEVSKFEGYCCENAKIKASSLNLAYVIYTSGTTGNPKGVMISHRSVVNRIQWMNRLYALEDSDKILQKTPYVFDVSVWELFWAIKTGACLVFARPEIHKDPLELKKLIQKQKITHIHFVPSMIMSFVEVLERKDSLPLKKVFCSGEVLSLQNIKALQEKLPESDVINLYGPTETTVDSTYDNCEEKNRSSIGRPIDNTQIYLMDRDLNLVPIGSIGELYIGGEGLARGYVGKADLTAERFIANPFGEGERVYKTGDLARWDGEGCLEYVGRKDHQVKIRGYRIELGEIESHLRGFEGIDQAVVLVKSHQGTGQDYLVGYYTAKDVIPDEVLSVFLGDRLPEYMIPSQFMMLERLPLTSSGKVDRKSLPDPELTNLDHYVGPRTDLEAQVCGIWQEVLGLERISVQDNFFKIGGHSLLATQVISRLRKHCKQEITLMELFDHPTIAGLSHILSQNNPSSLLVLPALVPVKERPKRPALSYSQQRLWFLDQLLPDVTLYNMPMALELKGSLNQNALENSFKDLSQRHEILRTVFKETDSGEGYQEVLSHIDFFEVIDLSDCVDQQHEVEFYKSQEESWHFDLSEGPLCRVKLLILSKDHHILLVTLHHIISDGWSMNILMDEISRLYTHYAFGKSLDLPVLTLQYVDYSLWQRQWLQGEVLERQLDYWQRKLEGIPDVIALPTDYARPKFLSYEGGHYRFEIDEELSDAIKALCQEKGVSLYMLLLSTLDILLHKLSGTEDIVVGSPVANRHYQETEGRIGFFVNTLVARARTLGRD
eukprot:gene16177-18296_t